MPINIKSSGKNAYRFQIKSGNRVVNHSYNNKEGAIEGARVMVRAVFAAFNMEAPDMSGDDWYIDQTKEKLETGDTIE